jgi:hypothetical protein
LRSGADAFDRIRTHLKAKGGDALVDLIVGIAERDPALFRKLDSASTVATATGGDDKKIEARLRKLIDGATRTGNFVDFRAAQAWAAGVDEAISAFADLASTEHAAVALKLAEHTIDRIVKAIEHVDDSDGYCTELLERAGTIHLAAAITARPEPVALARNLYAREIASEYGSFVGAAEDYAGVLGDAGLNEYRRLATERWAKLPPKSSRTRNPQDTAVEYRQLCNILDYFAERDGDLEQRIALRTKDLSAPWNYIELAKFCIEHGREEEALRIAQDGLHRFDDSYSDDRLLVLVAGLLVKFGRQSEADALLQQAFTQAPGFRLYQHWRKLSGASARDGALSRGSKPNWPRKAAAAAATG